MKHIFLFNQLGNANRLQHLSLYLFFDKASTNSVVPRAPKYCYFRQIVAAIMTSIHVKMAYETII